RRMALAGPAGHRPPARDGSRSARFHLHQVIVDYVALLRLTLDVERRRRERDLREIQRQRLHWHAVGTGALLVAGDAGFLQLDLEVGLDLLLGGRPPLNIDRLL